MYKHIVKGPILKAFVDKLFNESFDTTFIENIFLKKNFHGKYIKLSEN